MNKNIKINRRLLFLVAGILFFNINSKAQNSTKSPYSAYGIGELAPTSNGRIASLAGTGLAYSKANTLNMINPASLVNIDSLKFVFNLGAQARVGLLNQKNASERFVDYNITQLAFGFKAAPFWGTSIMLRPYSVVGYELSSVQKIDQNKIVEKNISGSGGINQIVWSNGFQLVKGLSVGLNTAFIFGNNEKIETTLVSGSSNFDKSTYKLKVASFYANTSVQYTFDTDDKNKYTLGLSYQPQFDLKADNTFKIENNSNSFVEDRLLDTKDFALPSKYGVGVSYNHNKQLWIGADYVFEQWSKAKFLAPAHNSNSVNAKYVDRTRISLALEYDANDGYARKFYKKMSYRMGAFLDSGYLEINDENIATIGVTAGVTIPFAKKKGELNLAFEFGKTAVDSDLLVQEKYMRFTLSANLFENWFFKRKYE